MGRACGDARLQRNPHPRWRGQQAGGWREGGDARSGQGETEEKEKKYLGPAELRATGAHDAGLAEAVDEGVKATEEIQLKKLGINTKRC